MPQTIFRLPAVKRESGDSRSTTYLRISQGLWTKQVSLGPRCVGWPAHEVAAINAARIAGWTDDRIRALVIELELARKQLDPMAMISSPSLSANLPARNTQQISSKRPGQRSAVAAPIAAIQQKTAKVQLPRQRSFQASAEKKS